MQTRNPHMLIPLHRGVHLSYRSTVPANYLHNIRPICTYTYAIASPFQQVGWHNSVRPRDERTAKLPPHPAGNTKLQGGSQRSSHLQEQRAQPSRPSPSQAESRSALPSKSARATPMRAPHAPVSPPKKNESRYTMSHSSQTKSEVTQIPELAAQMRWDTHSHHW